MRRYRKPVALTVAAGFLVACVCCIDGLPLKCLWRSLTGVPCPGCGSTRAVVALLHGRVAEALWLNPVAVLLCLYAAAVWVALWVDSVADTAGSHRLLHPPLSRAALVIVIAVMLGNWAWNILKYS